MSRGRGGGWVVTPIPPSGRRWLAAFWEAIHPQPPRVSGMGCRSDPYPLIGNRCRCESASIPDQTVT